MVNEIKQSNSDLNLLMKRMKHIIDDLRAGSYDMKKAIPNHIA